MYVCARDRILLRCGSFWSSVKVSRDRCQTKEKKNEIPRGSNKTPRARITYYTLLLLLYAYPCVRTPPSATYFDTSKTRLYGTRPRSRNDRLRHFDLSSLTFTFFFQKKTKTKTENTRRRSKVANMPDYEHIIYRISFCLLNDSSGSGYRILLVSRQRPLKHVNNINRRSV